MALSVLRTVFGRAGYLALAVFVSISVFIAATLVPNTALITVVFESADIGWDQKFALVTSLIGSIATNFTVFSAVSTMAIAVLLGMNVSLVTYVVRRNQERAQGSGMALGALGAVTGALGVGCAACGSLLLVNALAIFGATSLLALLPLKGGELSIIGIALLVLAIVLTMREIARPPVCTVK